MKTKLTSLVFALSTLCAAALPTTNQPPRAAVVSWDASPTPTATNYVLYCSTNSFWVGTNMVLSPVLAGTWPVSGQTTFTTPAILQVGQTYYFVVTAISNTVESAYSDQASVLVTPRPSVVPPMLHTTVLLVGAHDPFGPWEPLEMIACFDWQPRYDDFDFLKIVVPINR